MSAYAYPAPENPKVEPCPDCRSMKPAGARNHAALLLDRSGAVCQHGQLPRFNCVGRSVPPPCCWGVA